MLEAAADAVRSLGGEVTIPLSIIDGFAATVPADARAASWRPCPRCVQVSPDREVRLQGNYDDPADDENDGDEYTESEADVNANRDVGSLRRIAKSIEADWLHSRGYTGQGIGVALIDSGVVPVAGPARPARSSTARTCPSSRDGEACATSTPTATARTWPASSPATRHGRRSPAGIAPGRRASSTSRSRRPTAPPTSRRSSRRIDWVVAAPRRRRPEHPGARTCRSAPTASRTTRTDPLTYAVEQAWRNGIVVVVAAGNDGSSAPAASTTRPRPVRDRGRRGRPRHAHRRRRRQRRRRSSSRRRRRARPRPAWRPAGRSCQPARPGLVHRRRTTPTARVGDAALLPRQRHLAGRRGDRRRRGAAALSAPDADPGPGQGAADRAAPTRSATSTCSPGLRAAGPARLLPRPGPVQRHPDVRARDGHGRAGGQPRLGARPARRPAHQPARSTSFGRAWDGASWSGASWSGASWSGGSWSGASWSGALVVRRHAGWAPPGRAPRGRAPRWSGASWSGRLVVAAPRWSGASWIGASWSRARRGVRCFVELRGLGCVSSS